MNNILIRKTLILVTFIVCFILFSQAISQAAPEDLSPFVFDGCTWSPDGSWDNPNLFCECCLVHDMAYWQGGSEAERDRVDWEFKQCITERSGSEAVGWTYYWGVRAGGDPNPYFFFYYTRWRWGFGWPPGRLYTEMTEQERLRATELLNEYKSKNPNPCN
jgi:hypothetical protein